MDESALVVILPAVTTYRYSAPQGAGILHRGTAGSISINLEVPVKNDIAISHVVPLL